MEDVVDLVEEVVIGVESIHSSRGEGVFVCEFWLMNLHHVVWCEDVFVEVCRFFRVLVPRGFHCAEVQPVCLVLHEVEVPKQNGGVGVGVLDVLSNVFLVGRSALVCARGQRCSRC